jgi:hypothetical protein
MHNRQHLDYPTIFVNFIDDDIWILDEFARTWIESWAPHIHETVRFEELIRSRILLTLAAAAAGLSRAIQSKIRWRSSSAASRIMTLMHRTDCGGER